MPDEELYITDGNETLDLFDADRSLLLRGDNSLGDVEEGSAVRTMLFRTRFGTLRSGALTDRIIRENIQKARRLFLKAQDSLADDTVQLYVRIAGAQEPTIFDVVGGAAEEQDHFSQAYQVDRKAQVTLRVFTRPYGRTAETLLVDNAPFSGASQGVTDVRLVHTGGTVTSRNLMAQREGSMWTKTFAFDTGGATVAPLAAGDYIAWGNRYALASQWERVSFGVLTPQSGITSAVLEFSGPGSTWVAAPAGSWSCTFNSDGTPTNLFDVPAMLGSLRWDSDTWAAAGWTSLAIVAQNALWVRWRIVSVGGAPVAPVIVNGPYRSLYGMPWIPNGVVQGDEYAGALYNVTAGQQHAAYTIATVPGRTFAGIPTTEPPPLNIEMQSAESLVGGTTTQADIIGDTLASGTEALRVQVNVLTVDSALKMASTENAILTPMPTKLLSANGLNGSANWAVEWYGTVDRVDLTRTILGAWDGNGDNRRFWLGIDNGRFTAMFSTTGADIQRARATTAATTGKHWLRAEWDSAATYLRLYVDGVLRASRRISGGSLNTVQVAFMLGNVVSWDGPVDSYNNVSMSGFQGSHALVRFLDSSGVKTWSPTKAISAEPTTTAGVIALWTFNDAGSTSAINDTAPTPANLVARVGTTATAWSSKKTGGYFQGAGGAAGSVRIGVKLPRTLLEEYGEITYRFLLLVKALAPVQSDQPKWRLQLSLSGDVAAPYVTKVGQPHLVQTPNPDGSFDVIDLGVATLPPADMLRGFRGGASVDDYQWAYVYMDHPWTTLGVVEIDRLVCIPLRYGTIEYRTWPFGSPDSQYSTLYAVGAGEGVTIDGRRQGRRTAQVKASGFMDQKRNPFKRTVGDSPTLFPGQAHFFFVLPYGSWTPSGDDSPLTTRGDYTGTLRVSAEPKWRTLGTT
jgi:hypothetical protein